MTHHYKQTHEHSYVSHQNITTSLKANLTPVTHPVVCKDNLDKSLHYYKFYGSRIIEKMAPPCNIFPQTYLTLF